MHRKFASIALALLVLVVVCAAWAAPAPSEWFTVRYPNGLEDEKGKAVTQPVLVEMHLILTPALRADRIDPLEKKLRQADSDLDKQKIQAEIDQLRNATSIIVATQTLAPGGSQQFKLPLANYEVHFIPVNPPDRKPIIVRVTHSGGATEVPVQVTPAGEIIGGGPSVAELLQRIEDQQKEIAALLERVKKLEEKKS